MEKDFGKPEYNLEIALSGRMFKTFISNAHGSAMDEIEKYGLAINVAKRLFKGQKHATEKGYLLEGFAEGVETRKATFDICHCHNVSGLIILDKILKGEREYEGTPLIHFHGSDQKIYEVGVKDLKLCLKAYR